MSRGWLEQRERSTAAALHALVWAARKLGRRAGRAILLPVCLYFLFFAPRARRASRDYLRRVLGRPPRLLELFRHFYSFGTAALDRVFFLAGRLDLFDIRVAGESLLLDRRRAGGGCFLLGAHLGSFEVLRALGRKMGLRVNLLMFERNAQKVARIARAIDPDFDSHVIALGAPDSMLKVEACLARGEWVGMLGDRTLYDAGRVRVSFLGAPAFFPTAPFRIAAMLGRPIVLMAGLYRGDSRYDLCFEELLAVQQSDAGRDERIRAWAARYAARLEHYCRQAPYNWFNFYDFWADDPAAP
ncbi:MAG TPA: acyl-CoA synthetase [Burkholderiales bacterium]|nr:acyl-CoA synthetase [Burkholderiales bacterium]